MKDIERAYYQGLDVAAANDLHKILQNFNLYVTPKDEVGFPTDPVRGHIFDRLIQIDDKDNIKRWKYEMVLLIYAGSTMLLSQTSGVVQYTKNRPDDSFIEQMARKLYDKAANELFNAGLVKLVEANRQVSRYLQYR